MSARPPIPPPQGPGYKYPPAGSKIPAKGELFYGAAGNKHGAKEPSTATDPLPSSTFGNLGGHSGGPNQSGYPFYGARVEDTDGVDISDKYRKQLTGSAPPPPALATGPPAEPGQPEIKGPATDFYGANTRFPARDENGNADTMQPPVFNQFKAMKDEEGQNQVNEALRKASGPLETGSSGIGASHGQLPITTTDGFHISEDPRGEHATFDVDPSVNPDGTTHLYPNGSSSSLQPRQPGHVGNLPLNDVPNKMGHGPPEIIPGETHPLDGLKPVQETNPTGVGSFYPDPNLAAAAAAGT
ncbi:uncharacterized protein A1O5_06502 [Cladophialophora psammophila CBS 110553]|uniref:Uncharacterized protein n=1 Tax=Cladophialophora psammophila CBS 110553 TaxID=1182543 RepID=W9XJA3_9EURO|nr:uncharacterized protein A1O5_06502 [Cladophialophora psammophila CBS 110553]EXJ70434.1 hypothetical protein A1O5_06502 [Cladophialophora psammophila CBS 110553]